MSSEVLMCTWTLDTNEWHAYWRPSCGDRLFEFVADGPDENEFRFCPYCGKSIIEEVP